MLLLLAAALGSELVAPDVGGPPATERWLHPEAFTEGTPSAADALAPTRAGAGPVPLRLLPPDQGAAELRSDGRLAALHGLDAAVSRVAAEVTLAGPLVTEGAWLQGRVGGVVGRGGRRRALGQHEAVRAVVAPGDGHQVEVRAAADQGVAGPVADIPRGARAGWGAGAAAGWRWAPPGDDVWFEAHGLTEQRELVGTERQRQAARLGWGLQRGDEVVHAVRLGADVQRRWWSGSGYWTWRWLGGEAPGATEVLRTGLVADDVVRWRQTWLQAAVRVDSLGPSSLPGPRLQLGSAAGPVAGRGWIARRATHLDLPTAATGGPALRDEAGAALQLGQPDEGLWATARGMWTDHRAVPFFEGSRVDLTRLHSELSGGARGSRIDSRVRWAHVGGLSGGFPLDDGSLARFKDEIDVQAAVRLLDEARPLWVGVARHWRLGPLGVVAADPSWDQVVPVAYDERVVHLRHERDAGPTHVALGLQLAHLATDRAPAYTEQWIVVQGPVQPLPAQAGWRGQLWVRVRR